MNSDTPGMDPWKRQRYESQLRKIELFACCSATEIALIVDSCRERNFEEGQHLFYEDSEAPGLHVILSGKVSIQRRLRLGETFTVAIRQANDCVGELSLIDNQPASASAVALAPTQCIIIRPESFKRILNASHSLSLNILSLVSRRLREATDQLAIAHGYPVKYRLAIALTRQGKPTEDPNFLRIPQLPSQRELGEMVGATRESINRSLASLRAEGILRQEKDGTVFIDLLKLGKRVGLR